MTDHKLSHNTDLFSRMMFPKRTEPETEKESNIQLMENIDTLLSLYEKTKPSLFEIQSAIRSTIVQS